MRVFPSWGSTAPRRPWLKSYELVFTGDLRVVGVRLTFFAIILPFLTCGRPSGGNQSDDIGGSWVCVHDDEELP